MVQQQPKTRRWLKPWTKAGRRKFSWVQKASPSRAMHHLDWLAAAKSGLWDRATERVSTGSKWSKSRASRFACGTASKDPLRRWLWLSISHQSQKRGIADRWAIPSVPTGVHRSGATKAVGSSSQFRVKKDSEGLKLVLKKVERVLRVSLKIVM